MSVRSTVPSNKELKLTKLGKFGASQLDSSVGPAHVRGGSLNQIREYVGVVAGLALLSWAGPVCGQSSVSEAEAAGVRAVIAELDSAWNAADSKRWAAMFLPDAEFVNVSGLIFSGSAEIKARHEKIWHEHFRGSHATGTVRRLVLLSPNVAIADVNCAVRDYAYLPQTGARETEPGLVLSRMRHVLVKNKGHWRIVATENTLVAPSSP